MAKEELSPINRSKCVEIQNRLKTLMAAAQDFVQLVSHIDMSYESRLLEIQNLENHRDKVKGEVDDSQKKANQIVQQAQNDSDKNQQEIMRLVDEAKKMKFVLEEERKKVQVMKQEADALMAAATEKQKMADAAFQIVEERKKRLQAAIG